MEIRLPVSHQFIENMQNLLAEQPKELYIKERALLKQAEQQWKDQYHKVVPMSEQNMVRLVLCKRDAFWLAELIINRAQDLRDMSEGDFECSICESEVEHGRNLTELEEDEIASLTRLNDAMSFFFDVSAFQAPTIHTRKVAAHAVAE